MQKTVRFIDNFDELNHYFKEMDSGGIDYEMSLNADKGYESITIEFYSNGGWSEGISLFMSFKHLCTFHLGISMDSAFIGIQIDEIKEVKLSDMRDLMPYNIYTNKETSCYRFYSNEKPTIYYVICDEFSSWIEGYENINDVYKYSH